MANKNRDIRIPQQEWDALCSSPLEMIDFWEHRFETVLSEGMTGEDMESYSPDQITLIAYLMLRHEMLEGGLVQLIYNGYGPFIFLNPFAKALRLWGLKDFSKFVYSMREVYEKHRDEIEGRNLSEEDFMALYEICPEMEAYDDDFVEMEPTISCEIANFVACNKAQFGVVVE